MTVYHDEVEIEDFEYDEDEDIYYYPCPCGDQFQISRVDLIAGEEDATCPSCSLVVRVIYDKEAFVAKQEELEKRESRESVKEKAKVMANRGRGRGKASMSISSEQLGFGKGDALPPPVLQPPAKYPLLEYKPTPFDLTTELSYLLEIKRDFAEYIRESPSSVQSVIVKKDIERYSDRYQDMVTDKVSYEDRYDWTRLPAELKPGLRKRKGAKGSKLPAKKKKDVDIEKKLQELEQKEDIQQSDAEEDNKAEEEGEEKEEGEAPEGEDAEEMDEEMEDDTDYVNNYFDNGEGYDDDEDNLDEGPIY